MLAKISSENVKALGAADAAEFDSKLSQFIADATTSKTFMAENQVSLADVMKRLDAIEKGIVTEARIGELVTTGATSAISTWAGSEAGKKIIGGEASRITAEALANVGTQPAKPAPAAAGGETAEQKAAGLISAGKYEEAYAADPNLRNEFPTAKHFAAFARNAGAVKISQKN